MGLKFSAGREMTWGSMWNRRHFALIVAVPLALASCRDAKVESYQIPKEKDAEPPVAVQMPAPSEGSTAGTDVAVAAGPRLIWTAAAHWKSKPASAMRKGSYAIPGQGGADGDLSITAFPGDVGGPLANVNRWRGQVGLPPLSETELAGAVSPLEHDGLSFMVVDFEGGPKRILGAIVPYAEGTWFFKLTGPGDLVAREKPVFLTFLQSVKPSAP